ncbi:MAG: restriction endonuclease [Akkermansia sp.]|nr:restriction endonuclease [Akkermansia sp.]
MDLRFDTTLIKGYKSASQQARIMTEEWLARNMYCPICGAESIQKAESNAPVKDYVCKSCRAQYELKSKKSTTARFKSSVVDGVYRTMIERISSLENPSFFFMHYDRYEVNNLIIVPKCFFIPDIIQKRTQLKSTAARAGWEGCNILLGLVPDTAKIPIVRNGHVLPTEDVCKKYNQIYALQTKSIESRGWLFDVLQCTERLGATFSLNQVYSFVDLLKEKHPRNNNIEAKIRQQLQFLRDKGIIEFLSPGVYRKTNRS